MSNLVNGNLKTNSCQAFFTTAGATRSFHKTTKPTPEGWLLLESSDSIDSMLTIFIPHGTVECFRRMAERFRQCKYQLRNAKLLFQKCLVSSS